MRLKRVSRMNLALLDEIRIMGAGGGIKCADPNLFPVVFDRSGESGASRYNSKNAELVISLGSLAVLAVCLVAKFAQIAKSVVGFVSVDVVDKAARHLPVCIEPCKAVQVMFRPANSDAYVARSIAEASGDVTDIGSGASFEPRKNASLRVIFQKRSEVLMRQNKIALAHAVVPSKRWLWEVRGGASTPFPCDYFNSLATATGSQS